MGIDPIHGETIQGQRYQVGQQFKPHHDFFHPPRPIGRRWSARRPAHLDGDGLPQRRRGRRPDQLHQHRRRKVTPAPRQPAAAGTIWTGSASPTPIAMHQGCRSTAGIKYIITKWYRERPWGLCRRPDLLSAASGRAADLGRQHSFPAWKRTPMTPKRPSARRRPARLRRLRFRAQTAPGPPPAPARSAPRRERGRARSSGCSTTATRPISAATRSAPSSAAICATPTGSAISSPTNISRPSARPPSTISPRLPRSTASKLNATDRIAYDVFKWQRGEDLAEFQPDMLALTAVRPINHFSGFHTFYPVLRLGRARRRSATSRIMRTISPATAIMLGFIDRGDRPLPPRPRLGRGRHQAHDPQRDRPARPPAARRARGLAFLRAGR